MAPRFYWIQVNFSSEEVAQKLHCTTDTTDRKNTSAKTIKKKKEYF